MRGLNLASFKKMKEDPQTVTMIHKDGHALVISKGSLTPLHRKQIEALPTHNYAQGGKIQRYDEGTGNAEPVVEPIDNSTSSPSSSLQVEAIPPGSADAQPNPAPAAIPAQAQSSGQAPQTSGIEMQMKGNEAEAEAKINQAQAESNIYKQNLASQPAIPAGPLPTQQSLIAAQADKDKGLGDAFAKDRLDPSAYWKDGPDGGGHSKIAAGIGLLISSLGQVAGAQGENLGLKAINNGINQQLEIQKNHQGQDLTLWQMNRQKLGTDLAANLVTYNQLATIQQNRIQKAIADAQGPLAKAALLKANGALQTQKDINNNTFGLNATLNNQAGPGTEAAHSQALQSAAIYAPELAKDAQARTLPGYGVARIPPTPEDRGTLETLDALDNNLDRAKYLAQHVGTTLPGTPANKESNDVAQNIQLQLGQLYGFKRFPSEEAYKKYSDAVNAPGSIRTDLALKGYESLKDATANIRASVLSKLGVQPFRSAPGVLPGAQTGIQHVNGVPYQPVAGGLKRVR